MRASTESRPNKKFNQPDSGHLSRDSPSPCSQTRYPYSVATSATTDHVLAPAKPHSLLADYATLFKVRISTMVIITAGAGYYLGSLQSGISPFHIGLLQALIGITIVTCGSSALNQALERKSDALMRRTADRPMAAGRISLTHGLVLGFAATFLGSAYLAYTTNLLTGTLTLLTAIGYVAIYTPLKRITTINTFIGAFPGALPPLIGWTAARGIIEWPGVALFAILFVWQFPHFMAIGWMYREDYTRGGIRLTPNLPNTQYAALSTVVQALFYAAIMIPVSLWPFTLHVTGTPYAIAATVLGLGYLWYTIRFARIVRDPNSETSHRVARDLLRASVIYLPLLLAAMMLDAKGRLFF
jgi:protoheme IX farnesyltransferase